MLYDYNQTRPFEVDKRTGMLQKMLAEIGEDSYIETPFHANWGGRYLHLGNHVFINFNLSLVDDTHIYIEDCTMIGPNVMIATAGHPILPELRGKEPYQFNFPVHIGKNCWIGGNVSIMPGVSIGDNTVIGAGSVVTKNIPENVVAVGNPCRVLRKSTSMTENITTRIRLLIGTRLVNNNFLLIGELHTVKNRKIERRCL